MARKVEYITIDQEGRDQGKTFKITEMPALKAEKWATRAFLALAASGLDLPTDVNAGMAGIAALGLDVFRNLDFEKAEPLLDEMIECVQFQPSAQAPARELLLGNEGDIEEVGTLLTLRMAVFKLHVNFSTPADSPK